MASRRNAGSFCISVQRLFSLGAKVGIVRAQPQRRQAHDVILVLRLEAVRFAQVPFHLDPVALRERDVGQQGVIFRALFRAFRQPGHRHVRRRAIVETNRRAREKNQVV